MKKQRKSVHRKKPGGTAILLSAAWLLIFQQRVHTGGQNKYKSVVGDAALLAGSITCRTVLTGTAGGSTAGGSIAGSSIYGGSTAGGSAPLAVLLVALVAAAAVA